MTKPYDRVVRGHIVTPQGRIEGGWLAIAGGRIAALGAGAHPPASDVFDAGSAWVLPGAIDGQTHAGSYSGLRGLGPTTRSAVAGGVTTIVDMPYDDPVPVTDIETFEAKIAAVRQHAHCDVALYGTVAAGQPADTVAALAEAGIAALKISSFESHPIRFPRIPADQILDLLEAVADTSLPVGLHNEDQEIVRSRIARLKAAGRTGFEWHAPSRPEAAELAATAHFLELGAVTGAHVHIVHLSVGRGFELVRRYAEEGHRATAEMCVHYLMFEARDGDRLGNRLKVSPPIRDGQRDALWRHVENGDVAFVSSDHASWPIDNKQVASVFEAGAGIPGLETLVPAFYTGLDARTDEAPEEMCRLLSEGPARFFGLWPRKGAIAVGADADLMVLDASEGVTHDASRAHDDLRWSPFDGMRFSTRVAASFVRGQLAWDGTAVVSGAGSGQFVARQDD